MAETTMARAVRIGKAAGAAAAQFEAGMLMGGTAPRVASLWRVEYEAAWRAGAEATASDRDVEVTS